VYLIAVVWVGTVAIAELNKARTLRETLDKNAPESATAQEILRGIRQARQLGYSDNDIYNSLIQKFNGFIVSRELKGLGYRIAKNDGTTLAGLERALSKDAFGVQPDDLRKIILFDVAPYYAKGWGSWSCNGFHGRVRNDLSRPVRNLVLRAAFYGGQEELIEFKTFVLQNAAFEPGTPASFDEHFSVDHLPQDYSYILEVIEAGYVP
jgi:hypothetical protein